ncbi:hypothetical protein QQ045_023427 [Rhodiola kirilowii]
MTERRKLEIYLYLPPRDRTNGQIHRFLHAEKLHPDFRCSLNAWLIAKDKLLTRDRLRLRGLAVDAICPVCEAEPESRNHLFFSCKECIQETKAINAVIWNIKMKLSAILSKTVANEDDDLIGRWK